jgi:hypothetical protein
MKQPFFVQFSALDTSAEGIQVATATVFGLWPDPLLPREEVDKPSSAAGAAAVDLSDLRRVFFGNSLNRCN